MSFTTINSKYKRKFIRFPSIFLECSVNFVCCAVRIVVVFQGQCTSSFSKFSTYLSSVCEEKRNKATIAVSSTGPVALSFASATFSALGSGLRVAFRDFVSSLILWGLQRGV